MRSTWNENGNACLPIDFYFPADPGMFGGVKIKKALPCPASVEYTKRPES